MKSLCSENILHVLDLSPPSFWNSRSPLLQPPRDDTVNHAAARNRAGGGVLREHDDLGLIIDWSYSSDCVTFNGWAEGNHQHLLMVWEENIYSSVQEMFLVRVIFLPSQIVWLRHYQRAFPLHPLKIQALRTPLWPAIAGLCTVRAHVQPQWIT